MIDLDQEIRTHSNIIDEKDKNINYYTERLEKLKPNGILSDYVYLQFDDGFKTRLSAADIHALLVSQQKQREDCIDDLAQIMRAAVVRSDIPDYNY